MNSTIDSRQPFAAADHHPHLHAAAGGSDKKERFIGVGIKTTKQG